MKKVCVITNVKRDKDYNISRELVKILNEYHYHVVAKDEQLAKATGADTARDYSGCEIAFVVGGDGTILSASQQLAPFNVPILGINMGNIGFLTECSPNEIKEAVLRVYNGDFAFETRTMVEASILDRNGNSIKEGITALNEIAILRAIDKGVVRLDVFIAEKHIARYTGTGVLVSTPTGSTAYSLSAGGPIINPSVKGLIITPVCALTLYSRPIVTSDEDLIEFKLVDHWDDTYLVSDGQYTYTLEYGSSIRVVKSKLAARFIRFREIGFFHKLKDKLTEWNKPVDVERGV